MRFCEWRRIAATKESADSQAARMSWVMLLKWKQFQTVAKRQRVAQKTRKLNNAALCVGHLTLLGLTLLANFDIGHENTAQTHNVSAGVCFLSFMIYGVLVLVLSHKLNMRLWFWPRVCCVSLAIVSLLALVPMFLIYNDKSPKHWTGAVCECAVVLRLDCVLSTKSCSQQWQIRWFSACCSLR